MKIGNLMTIYYRQTRRYRFKGLAIIFLFTIAIVMIHLAIYEREMGRYRITVTKQLLTDRDHLYNIKVWNNIGMESIVEEGMELFLQDLKSLSGVDSSGRFFNCNEVFTELQEDQMFLEYNQRLLEGTKLEGNAFLIDMYYIDRDLTFLFHVKELSQAKHRREIIPVLVGYNYREYFKEGEKYTNLDGVQFEICGVLPKGFCLPALSLLSSPVPSELMDNKMIALYDDFVNPMHMYTLNATDSIYCVTNGTEETVEQIEKLAKQSFINIKIATIDELIVQYEEDNRWALRTTALFTGITVLAAFLAMISLSVIQILLKKQEYGILFANGISKAEGVKLIALENGMRQLSAFILGTLITYQRIIPTELTYRYQVIFIFKKMVVWKTFFMVCLLFVGSISIPAIVLGKMRVIELLGGDEL